MRGQMIALRGQNYPLRGSLGAAQDDLKAVLALLPGGESLDQRVADMETYIKGLAADGAQAGVQPYVIGGLALAAGALLFAYSAWQTARAK